MKSKILIEKEKNTNTGITLIALVITKIGQYKVGKFFKCYI